MACNLVRNKEGDIHNVFTDDGKPSILYNEINRVLNNNTASQITSINNSASKNDNTTDYFVFLGNNNIKINNTSSGADITLTSSGNSYTISEEKIFIIAFLFEFNFLNNFNFD